MTITRITATAAAALVAVAGLALSTGSADAATPRSPRCMTKAEWRKIQHGMTRTQVRQITGIPGKVTDLTEYEDGTHTLTVGLQQCTRKGRPARGSWNRVSIQFVDYRYDADWNLIRTPYVVDYKGSWSSPVVF
jgi:hypothetical protein